MKRMNVREFRAHISELTEETIEVTRYGESVGYWVPHSMTTMPKKPAVARKIKPTFAIKTPPLGGSVGGGSIVSDAVLDDIVERMRVFNEEMKKLGVTKK